MEIELFPNQSINETIKSLKVGDTLILNDGIYFEKIIVRNSGILIKAKNKHKAIIQNKDYYHKIMDDNNECNTFNTFTMYIWGNNIKLEGLIIENLSTPSSIYGQAVALHVDGTNFECNNCIIKSAQDTLFTGPLPDDLLIRYKGFYNKARLLGKPSIQKYKNCDIIGDVDFIFGGATALFEKCNIISISRESDTSAYICAPSHAKDLPYGYLFYECNLIGEGKTFLARPWRDYGCVAFISCNLKNHINPLGFDNWSNTNRDKTARFYEYSKNVDSSQRVGWSKQLTETEAETYYEKFMKYITN